MLIKKIMNYGKAEITYNQKEILSKQPILKNLFWETTLRCNAKCKHCGSRAGENIDIQNELTTQEIKEALKSIASKIDASKILLNITGGEPLVREDLFEVMDFAHNKLGFKWGMTTNGLLMNEEIINKMKETGIETISISIDGLEDSHDYFRGIKGAYSKTISNIKKLQKDKFLKVFQITTVVNKSNINELEQLYEVMKDLEVDSWRVVNMDPIGRAIENNNLLLEKEDYKYLFEFIEKKRKLKDFEVTYGCSHFLGMERENTIRDNCFFCHTGFATASILYNGDIFVCPNVDRRKELIQGNIRKDDFVDIWINKFEWFRNLDKFKVGKCAKCQDWKYCRGDSLHTWDFDTNSPKFCINQFMEEKNYEKNNK